MTPAEHLLTGFPAALRAAGLPVDPARGADFLRAVGASRLRDAADLARIGRVTLTGSREEFPLFDAVFAAWFGDAPGARPRRPPRRRPPRRPATAPAATPSSSSPPAPPPAAPPPPTRSPAPATFRPAAEDERRALARLRPAFARLPEVERRRWVPSPAGRRLDLPRTARAARRTFGETLHLLRQAREVRPRRLLLLVDVSGSMQAQSETMLRFAQALTRARGRVETFTFGTRLTRVTAALRRRDGEAALARLAEQVSDFDGGTRIGEALRDLPRPPHQRRPRPRRRGRRVLRRPRARRPGPDDRRRPPPRPPRPPPGLGEPARRRPALPPGHPRHGRHPARPRRPRSTAAASPPWPACRSASPPSSASPAARRARLQGDDPHDRHRRRASPHLAPGRPALAAGPDGPAHLRPLRADPPRLPDRGVPRRHRRHRRREIGLRPDQLGQGRRRRRGRLGAGDRRRPRLAARHRRLRRPPRRRRRRRC